jgi:DNA-binding transcriptional ArsR family regulator
MYGCRVGSSPSYADTLAVLDRVGRALSDGTRRRILLRLADAPDCGLVVADAEGRRVRYRLSDVRLAHALLDLAGLRLHPAPGHLAVDSSPDAVAG